MLLDFYGELLTEKQAKAMELYYNEDLSLAEIAEPLSISRQGVRDSIKRGEKQLIDLENTLGLLKRFKEIERDVVDIEEMFTELKTYIDTYIHSEKLSSAVSEISDKIKSITEKL
ncbi:MAG: DNA-binding protein [Clostridia bacterium]|nr:DNA-binding protein [Clostridia bacterium]